MSKYRIAWLPGDGVGVDVMNATKIVLESKAGREYVHGDIGWEFWCRKAIRSRTHDHVLKETDCALFGAITSKPKEKRRRSWRRR